MDELISAPDAGYVAVVTFRLGSAAFLGGLIGAEREWVGKAAGLRTHMTVALGCAAFVLIATDGSADNADLSRVIQGIAAGIGFIGAGSILKLQEQEDIQGLTTAATVWLTAAVGVAAGAGKVWLAAVTVACAFVVLVVMSGVSRWLNRKGPGPTEVT